MLYIFKEAFSVTTQGQEHTIDSIEVSAPTARIVMCSVLESELNKCLMRIAKERQSLAVDDAEVRVNEEVEVEDEISKANQISYMLALGGADLRKCYDALKTCVTQSKATIGSGLKCTSVLFDEIPYKELKGLLAEYIVNFINTLEF